MEIKVKKALSVKALLIRLAILFGAFIVLVGVLLLVGTLYGSTLEDNQLSFVLMYISIFIMIVVSVLLTIVMFYQYKIFYKGFYLTARSNLIDVSKNKKIFQKYPVNFLREFDELNIAITEAEDAIKNNIIFSQELDYRKLDLKYINKEYNVIEYYSFSKNISNFILGSEAFRNAVLCLTFNEPLNSIFPGNSINELYSKIRTIFNYPNIIIGQKRDFSALYIYIPRFESFSGLKEEAELFLKHNPVMKSLGNKNVISMGQISAVFYPYSDMEDILTDLSYATRQGKTINFYIPQRYGKDNNKYTLHSTMNMNYVNKILSSLASMNQSQTSEQQAQIVRKEVKALAAYLNIDCAGVVAYSRNKRQYLPSFTIDMPNQEPLFKNGQKIDVNFLHALSEVVDDDGTYYFSNRKRLSYALSTYLDKLNVASGFVYYIKDEERPLGFVYFINREKDLILDSYLRESAFAISFFIGSYIREYSNQHRLLAAEEREEQILKLSGFMSLRVDKDTYEITEVSNNLNHLYDTDLRHKICYKELHGRDMPCENCPMRTNMKARNTLINKRNYEVSLVLNNRRSQTARLLLKPSAEDKELPNRFDQDLLINSSYSLHEDFQNIYRTHGKGYLLLLYTENIDELVSKYGNEGLNAYYRAFISALKNSIKKYHNYYFFNSRTIAIDVTDAGRTEIINLAEQIYNISKNQFTSGSENEFIPLTLSYVACKYPHQFATAEDFLRNANSALVSYDHDEHKDQICFVQNSYFRSASRKDFINTVIDESFAEGTFSAKLQPIIKTSSKRIMGAELLIRLSDTYRNMSIGADEVIKVAAAEGKIGVISDALTKYIGDFYQKFGHSLFKESGFGRISLNTDYSYFSDPKFLPKIDEVMNTYYFPKNFLTFEINEEDILKNFDFYKDILHKTSSLGVNLVVDQYTGEYVSLEKIKTLGFSEIKINRKIVKDMDVNKSNFNQVRQIVDIANKFKLKVSLVGVENQEQFYLIRDIDQDITVQGYYFYKPLDYPELIEAIKMQ